MTQNNILKEFDALPPEAQKQVLDFIAFLQMQYKPKRIKQVKQKAKLSNESFIGIWRNRDDLENSSDWVRKTRTSEWG